MYSVYCDGECIYSTNWTTEEYQLLNPKLSLQDNLAGSFSFTIHNIHPFYDKLKPFTSTLTIKRNNEYIWGGRILSMEENFYKQKSIVCEGDLAYLNDTIQERYDAVGTMRGCLEYIIRWHNSKVAPSRQFAVGAVTVYPTGEWDADVKYRSDYNTTLEVLMKLVELYGGHLRVRRVEDQMFLDYLKDPPNTSGQTIEFGSNLLSFSKTFDISNLATVILPKGAEIQQETEDGKEPLWTKYTTIASVNGGSDLVQNDKLVELYGRIEAIVEFSDIDDPQTLYDKAVEYLTDTQYKDMELELSVFDLHYADENYDAFDILDNVRVVSSPHGLDKYFPITKIDIVLNQPESTTITLNSVIKNEISANVSRVDSSVASLYDDTISKVKLEASKLVDEAKRNATNLINMATNGYVTLVEKDGHVDSIVISDYPDYTKAQRRWTWNVNGLGYSNDGGETYGLAMTMDGAIVADYITAGVLNAAVIRAGVLKDVVGNTFWNLETGEFSMSKGEITLGDKKFVVNSDGYLWAVYGYIGGFEITDTDIHNDSITLYSEGIRIKKDSINVGKIGVNVLSTNENKKGLVFDLEATGEYMCWAARLKPDDLNYTIRMAYYRTENVVRLNCDLDMNGYTIRNTGLSGVVSGRTGFVQFVQMSGSNPKYMTFQNGILTGIVSTRPTDMSEIY